MSWCRAVLLAGERKNENLRTTGQTDGSHLVPAFEDCPPGKRQWQPSNTWLIPIDSIDTVGEVGCNDCSDK